MKIQPIVRCGFVGKCQSSPASYGSHMGGIYTYMSPSPTRIAAYAIQQLEQARTKDVEAHEANLAAMDANQAVRERVEALMTEVGMPKSYTTTDHRSRARYPKTIRHDAGYLGDLARECQTYDGFDAATRTYEDLLKRYQAYAEQADRDEQNERTRKEQQIEKEKAERRANVELARIVVRYELNPDSSWDDVLQELRRRDQRLDLALAMQATRGDWSDGPYRVRDALSRFTIITDMDKEIAAGVACGLIDFDDGRVFRDMTYSYDRIFSLIEDQQLVADTQLASSKVRAHD